MDIISHRRNSWKGGDSEKASLTKEAPPPSYRKLAPYHSFGAPAGSSQGRAGQPGTHVAVPRGPACPGVCPVFLTWPGPRNNETWLNL